jgi:hypothetical protein
MPGWLRTSVSLFGPRNARGADSGGFMIRPRNFSGRLQREADRRTGWHR